MGYHHPPAMATEVLDLLACRPGHTVVDGTLGGCGHARLICRRIQPGGRLVGIDRDEAAIANARQVLAPWAQAVHLVRGNFADMGRILADAGIGAVDGILLDLGLSLYQLKQSGRGFSFQADEPLDMRMDTRQQTTAADLVNRMDADRLAQLLRDLGQQPAAGRIARRIVAERRKGPIRTAAHLAQVVAAAVGGRGRKRRIHPATQVFMALRIAVNAELDALDRFLDTALDLLVPGGRLVILSFHSLEDRRVKQRFRQWSGRCQCPPALPQCRCGAQQQVRLLTPRALKPSAEEVHRNPLARSTRLRAVEKRQPTP